MKTKQIFRNKWLEITVGEPTLIFQYSRYVKEFGDYNGAPLYYNGEENDRIIIGLPFITFYFILPWSTAYKEKETWKNDDCKNYGFGFYNVENYNKFPDELFLYFGYKTKIYDLPWKLKFYKRTVYDTNEKEYIQYANSKKNDPWVIQKISDINNFDINNTEYNFNYPYKYIRKNGQIQKTIAIFHKEEREWRRKWLIWTSLFNFKKKVIEIKFKDEIGENVDSWKGGCVGCDYEILPNEHPKSAIERMERERKFN